MQIKRGILTNFLKSPKPIFAHIKACTFVYKRQLLYLLRTRLTMLKDDSEATFVKGILRTSQAIDANSLKQLKLSFQYATTFKFLNENNSNTGSSKYVSNSNFSLPPVF